MMDQSLASLVTQEREDYFGRFFTALERVGCSLLLRFGQHELHHPVAAKVNFLRVSTW
jgi:hypothetical protein